MSTNTIPFARPHVATGGALARLVNAFDKAAQHPAGPNRLDKDLRAQLREAARIHNPAMLGCDQRAWAAAQHLIHVWLHEEDEAIGTLAFAAAVAAVSLVRFASARPPQEAA